MKYYKDLEKLLQNEHAFRQKQAQEAIFEKLTDNWDMVSNLPLSVKQKLSQDFSLKINHKIFKSKLDETIKAVITLDDGLQIETVLMRSKRGRNTICVSSQVGCPLGCSFCATGQMGFKRNLSDWEIIQQVLLFARILKQENKQISNVVFMGMGEPLLNFGQVLSAIKILNNKDTLRLGSRRFSISTVGIPEGINKLSEESMEINLAISLHAPNDSLRSKLMRVNTQYSIGSVLKAVDNYIAATNRKVMFEYLMLKDVNDSENLAYELTGLVHNKLAMVNLIKYNPTSGFESSSQEQIEKFKKILEGEGIEVTQRYSFGQDIAAACGQLATK